MRSNLFYRLSAVLCILLISLSSNAQARNRRHAGTSARLDSAVETIIVKGVSFKMIRVEGGTFTMGATSEQVLDAYNDEKPAHQVTLSTFSIGETEVTQELWKAVMGSNPSYHKGLRLPVEKVSWYDCQEFITKLNKLTGRKFRLPTEAEWEYAARGGKKSKGYKYSGSDSFGDVTWSDDDGGHKTHDVGTKRANELGLYDMSGNVSEWVQDSPAAYSSSEQTNPTDSYRVYRGGSYNTLTRLCRVSARCNSWADDRGLDKGLRLAL